MNYPEQKQKTFTRTRPKTNTLLKNIYIWMSLALILTAVVAYSVSRNTQMLQFLYSNAIFMILLIFAQLGCVIFLSARIQKMSVGTALFTFALYAILTGVTFSSIFLVFTRASIANAFFCTAIMFGGMSLYAMTTKRDLNSWGSYLIMGLWGIIIASVINMFLGSATLYYMISYIGVVLFLGLTAWDTKKLIRIGENIEGIDEDSYIKLSIYGALTLYLDFINLFLFILRIFGRSNN